MIKWIDAAFRLHDAGYTLEEIGRHVGVSKQRVHQVLANSGIRRNAKATQKMKRDKLLRHVVEDYAEGRTLAQMAKSRGIDKKWISAALREKGIKLRRSGCLKRTLDYDQIKELYVSGISMRLIAKKLNCSVTGVNEALHTMGVKIRGTGARTPIRARKSL